MKKLLGLVAVVVAIALVSFTTERKQTNLDFLFQGSAADLQIPSKVADPNMYWDDASASILCDNTNVKACGVLNVPAANYQAVSGFPGRFQLIKTGTGAVTITTATVDLTNYYINTVSAGTRKNKS